jgi:hypothetical protein
MAKFTIKLTSSDPHWVRLGNGKYAVELADRWEARTPYSDYTAPRPYIDIKIPELKGSKGREDQDKVVQQRLALHRA